MNKDHDLKSVERGPLNLFHAATEREKGQAEKQPAKESANKKELDNRG